MYVPRSRYRHPRGNLGPCGILNAKITADYDGHRTVAAVMRLGWALVQIFAQGETPMTGTYLRREDHILDGSKEQERRLMSAGVARTGIEVAIVNSEDREFPRDKT